MDSFEILLTALAVSVDAFSVSVGGAFCCRSGKWLKNACLAALFFGGFQFLMPLAGSFIAGFPARSISDAGNKIAFVLLCLIGGKMICDGLRTRGKDALADCRGSVFFTCKTLFVSGVATSLDAFAVGGGLAFAGKAVFLPCAAMGVVTGAASLVGVYLGARLARLNLRPGRGLPEWLLLSAGGAAIIFVGVKILFS